MAIFFSDFFEVSPEQIEDYGALNISLINDLPLFVDPFLLFNSEDQKYKQLHDEIIQYMRFLKEMSLGDGIKPHLITAWFRFPEVKQNWLGFSKEGNKGHGLGKEFAEALHRNLNSVFRNFGDETITRSSHLEKLCLVREGVGRDNMSDFTTNLIEGYLAQYTEKFAIENLSEKYLKKVRKKVKFNYESRTWSSAIFKLPYINNDYVLLTPKDILTRDEAWINRSDLLDSFQEITKALPNPVLRSQVNEYLLRVIPHEPTAKKKEIQAAIGLAVEKFPEVIDYYIKYKEEKGDKAKSLAEERVALVQALFVDQIGSLVNDYLKPIGFYKNAGNTYEEAKQRVLFLKDVIENKGGHRLFYIKGKQVERESDLQVAYRLTWYATDSDISREVNDGRGPVDFKVSRGRADKTLVEFKLASNSQIEKNLVKQCEIYEKSSDVTHSSLKVIMYFSEQQLLKVQRILARLNISSSPNIILIDARADNKPSGSKA
jgi:hypothetical protein